MPRRVISVESNSPKINSFNSDLKDLRTILITNGSKYGPCYAGRGNDGCWRSLTEGDVGDTIGVQLYYHNTSNYLATNVSVGIKPMDLTPNFIHIIRGGVLVNGYISIGDSATIALANESVLEFVPKSIKWFPNQSLVGTGISNESDLFSNYGFNIGDLPSGWKTQGTVTFKLSCERCFQKRVKFNFGPSFLCLRTPTPSFHHCFHLRRRLLFSPTMNKSH